MSRLEEFGAGEDGWTEWVRPIYEPEPFRLACCDCGLVHDVEFRIFEGKPEFRMRRNNRSTGQMRRKRPKEGE